MKINQILIHLGIVLISVIGVSYPYRFMNGGIFDSFYAVIHLIIVLALYVIFGYKFEEKKKFDFLNYVTVAIVGILILFTALADSPNDLDWKNGNGGIFWFVYTIYISGITTPIGVILNFNFSPKNFNFLVFILGVFSIIPSILLGLGGYLKINSKRNQIKGYHKKSAFNK